MMARELDAILWRLALISVESEDPDDLRREDGLIHSIFVNLGSESIAETIAGTVERNLMTVERGVGIIERSRPKRKGVISVKWLPMAVIVWAATAPVIGGCESSQLGDCGDVELVLLRATPVDESGDLVVNGPAVLRGTEPYSVEFDRGERFEVSGLGLELPPEFRAYVEVETKSSPPRWTPDTRVVVSEITENLNRGDLIGAIWFGGPFMAGDFGGITYATEPSGDVDDACVGVESVQHNLIVHEGSERRKVGERCSARLGGYIISHVRSFELGGNVATCMDDRLRYSEGSIIRSDSRELQ